MMSRVLGATKVLLAAAKAGAKASPKPTLARPSGIVKSLPVSPAMRKFMGIPEVSRTEAVKKVWQYIKANDLQNPADKREIICDEKLKTIFDGRDKVGFLEIARLLSQHFVKTN